MKTTKHLIVLCVFLATFLVGGIALANDSGIFDSATSCSAPEATTSSTYTNSLGQVFILIPAGTFIMGSPSDEPGRSSNEGPQHSVTITQDFYMQQTEVTQAQWEAVMGSNPSYFFDCPTCPVDTVSWDDVQDFIEKMNARGEGVYGLPTEAQWEYAARGGTTTPFYNGEITELDCGYDANLDAIGWYCSCFESHPVAQKDPNAWGLYDMSGNVYEWCSDWYDADYYSNSPTDDPQGPSTGSYRVFRGGGWHSLAQNCRSAHRFNLTAHSRYFNVGFRLVRYHPGYAH
jgi:formylglycine-generating enzyme required for sulfatase activity